MTAPINHPQMALQIAAWEVVAEAQQLSAMQRHLSDRAARLNRWLLPTLLGAAALLSSVCVIAQIMIHLDAGV
ncbi:hypothetical protein [Novosphingobium guangzhouense]|uniref:Uncharacterized protein n=1 Tax=Novosphingobium guangzhouense TaxID=1850347 RepID=A0A2K2G0H8_9SPHN|nr:hypothetical protein [Novosphingobium guangzhouense]PNU04559.1 hypothetical protein A8V01_19285 [Novosphingobium guangzhouense]